MNRFGRRQLREHHYYDHQDDEDYEDDPQQYEVKKYSKKSKKSSGLPASLSTEEITPYVNLQDFESDETSPPSLQPTSIPSANPSSPPSTKESFFPSYGFHLLSNEISFLNPEKPGTNPVAFERYQQEAVVVNFGLSYTVTTVEMPTSVDYAEAWNFTQTFVKAHFSNSETAMVGAHHYSFNNRPIQIDFETTIYTSNTLTDWDSVVYLAFYGDTYVSQMKNAVESTILSSTTKVDVSVSKNNTWVVEQESKVVAPSSASSKEGSFGGDFGVAAFLLTTTIIILLIAAVVGMLRKRRKMQYGFFKTTSQNLEDHHRSQHEIPTDIYLSETKQATLTNDCF